MAKYATHKATATGKATTLERKLTKARKQAPALPLAVLARELGVKVVTK